MEVNEIMTYLNDWRKNTTNQLGLIVNAKDSVKIKVQDKEGNSVFLPEKNMEGFKIGIQLALNLINDTFPIKETKDSDDNK